MAKSTAVPKIAGEAAYTPEEFSQASQSFASERERLGLQGVSREADLGNVRRAEAGLAEAESAQKIGVKEAGVEATQSYVQDVNRQQEEYRNKISANPLPTHKPTQEDLSTYAQMGSLMMTMGLMLGAGGKNNAKLGLDAMTGMMNGWRKGRQDLWKQEAINFEKAFNKIKADREAIYKNLQEGLKLASTNYAAAKEKLETAAFIAGEGSALKKRIDARDFKAVAEIKEGIRKTQNELEDKIRRMASGLAQQRLQRELIAEQRRANAAQAAEKTQKATQQQFIVQRAVNALGGVQSALETIVALPEGSTTGWLPNLQTKDGMFSAVRNQLGRKISSVDAEFMNTLFSGIGRNLASIEASGTATGLTGLANQLQTGVYINAGVDDPFKVAMKLADIRRIATENIRPSINSGLMPKQQAEEAQRLVEQIEKIVPYTTLDVANAYRQAKGGARQTISGSVNRAMSKGSESTTYDDAEKEARYQKWLKENPQ
jgi:hypothetical protein